MVALKTDSATVAAIYAAYADKAEDTRAHLGASEIGHDCDRKLWLGFRWATKPQFSGRQRRLFETGHLAESRMIANLRMTGATILDRDPSTGRQWLVAEYGGHFGGSLDALGYGILEAPQTWHVVEFKTHNQKSFTHLQKHGVVESKPMHYVQTQVYMYKMRATRTLYMAHNKNTDELYTERYKLDKQVAEWALDRAKRIIFSAEPPARLSDNADYYICRWCDHLENCHNGAFAEINCRTCLHSTPLTDGTWHCDEHNKLLTVDEQRAACTRHMYVPQLVDGEPVRADTDGVLYRMRDGSEWLNAPS